MIKTRTHIILWLSVIVTILVIISSAAGLFSGSGAAQPFEYVNHYGDSVMIYGDGLYKNDSLFKAPISRGTDFSIRLFAVPAFMVMMMKTIKKPTWTNQVALVAFSALFLYYSANLCFGVTYNQLFLVYITLFGTSLYGFIIASPL